MTELGDKLKDAIAAHNNDIENAVWKLQNGDSVKLINCTESELNKYYKHAYDMLYNKSLKNPGKYVVRDNIKTLYSGCNTMLFIRHLLYECKVDSLSSTRDIAKFITRFKQLNNCDSTESISIAFNQLMPIYNSITINDLLDGCYDRLGVINKKMISDKFILFQGIWLTDSEMEDLTEYDDNGNLRNRIEVAKERLVINPQIKLRSNPSGLTYTQFRSIVQMSSMPKISDLPTQTLLTLRDKVLLLLDNDLDYHIDKWSSLLKTMEKIAEHNNISLRV